MRHLIERVLELAEEEEGPSVRPTSVEEMESNDAELRRLLESLQPRIRYMVSEVLAVTQLADCMRKGCSKTGLLQDTQSIRMRKHC